MLEKIWDEPYKNKKILCDDVLVGAASDGSLIYLPSGKGAPSRNVVVFYGSNTQKKDFLTTRIFTSMTGGKSIVILGSDIKKEIYDIARENDYVIKEISFNDNETNSNHWELFNLLKDTDPVAETQKFVDRIAKAKKINPSANQINALNYISVVLLYTRYYLNGNLKKFSYYLRNYDAFEKQIGFLNETDNIRHYFEFAKNANNYFKWDIPTVSSVLQPFFSKPTLKKLNSGSMSVDEITDRKCIYILNPSGLYGWISSFIMSYLLECDSDFDVYVDQADFSIPDFKNLTKRCQHKVSLLSNNMEDIKSNYDDILSNFGTKLAFHGCDINAAEYLSRISGIDPGNNKFKGNCFPQEIVSCGQKKVILFVLSSKKYTYNYIDLSYLQDVVKASL